MWRKTGLRDRVKSPVDRSSTCSGHLVVEGEETRGRSNVNVETEDPTGARLLLRLLQS